MAQVRETIRFALVVPLPLEGLVLNPYPWLLSCGPNLIRALVLSKFRYGSAARWRLFQEPSRCYDPSIRDVSFSLQIKNSRIFKNFPTVPVIEGFVLFRWCRRREDLAGPV